MQDLTVVCGRCGAQIPVTESLAAPLLEASKKNFERLLMEKNQELREQSREMEERRRSLVSAEEALNATIEQRVKAAADKLAVDEQRKARAFVEREMSGQQKALEEAENLLKTREAELASANEVKAEFLREKRKLEEATRALPVTIQQKVDEELSVSRVQLRAEIESEVRLEVRQKDVVLESMKTEIANLRRKSEQGSSQIQGEVWERELFEVLSTKFPHDTIRRISKGEYGGDCLQEVRNIQGKLCGSILWEAKRTKNWDEKWLPKLKLDQRGAKADTAIIVSHVLPRDVINFEQRDDVWITGPDCLIPVAGALRHLLIEVQATKRANEGHQDKAALIYQYVTSPGFKRRLTALSDAYKTMQDDLAAEQKVMKTQWAKRAKQLEVMVDATVGMAGDLQGIAGKSILEVEAFSLSALGSGA